MAKFATTREVNCPYCHDEKVVKNGKGAHGKQRYKCKTCGKRFLHTGQVGGSATAGQDATAQRGRRYICANPKARADAGSVKEAQMDALTVPRNQLLQEDAIDLLRSLPDSSVDLVVTSPPYADNRKEPYSGVPIDKYVDWFMPYSREILRILKVDGSFVLNIKERAVNGERQTYVLEIILEMKQQGWFWTEEYIWHKKNCYPGKWSNRFRDAWERCLHFTKSKRFRMYQDAVMVPVGDWAETRLKNLSPTDQTRDESRVQSGFGKNVSNWIDREMVYPSNVLHMATETGNRGHSAAFPIGLPTWFIKLFTEEGDLVLDPFMGSGTTALAAMRLNRDYLGAEISTEYFQVAQEAIAAGRGLL